MLFVVLNIMNDAVDPRSRNHVSRLVFRSHRKSISLITSRFKGPLPATHPRTLPFRARKWSDPIPKGGRKSGNNYFDKSMRRTGGS